MKNKELLGILAAGILLVITMVGGYFYLEKNKNVDEENFNTVSEADLTDTDKLSDVDEKPLANNTSEIYPIWKQNPQKKDIFNSLKYTENYLIGTTENNENVIMSVTGEMGYSFSYIIEGNDGTYTILSKNIDPYLLDLYKNNVPGLIVDNTSYIPEVMLPESILVNGINFEIDSYRKTFVSSAHNKDLSVKIADTDYGPMYRLSVNRFQEKTNKINAYNYYITLPDSTVEYYKITPIDIFADDNTLKINFDENVYTAIKDSVYTKNVISSGCSVETLYLSDLDENNLLKIGTSNDGIPVYKLLPSQDDIFQLVYEQYKTSRSYSNDYLSEDEFNESVVIIVVKNKIGEYENYISNGFAPLAECGKPVIYLYPEQKTEVSVEVGADVRISDPLYVDGWDVVAHEDGTLLYKGDQYGSLFWEGLGHGQYPEITEGRVIRTEDFINEIKSDLTKAGLNRKEISDFVDFWKDYVPSEEYTRITWLDTEEMNELAPLKVHPNPDTVIRVFMDFEGQDTKETNLKPQEINKKDRAGFTLVEWGGLLVK